MLISVLSFIVGLTGAGLLSAGAWLISPSVGLITGGIICLGWSYDNPGLFLRRQQWRR